MALDKRLGFTRINNSPFSGIEDLYNEPLDMNKKNITNPIKKTIQEHGCTYNDSGIKRRIGHYFEILSQGIYGGNLNESYFVNEGSGLVFNPDIRNGSRFHDSKSIAHSKTLKIGFEQITRYAILHGFDVDGQTPEVFYDFFRYGVKEPLNRYRQSSLKEMVDDLSDNVRAMISLPFSAAVNIHRQKGDPEISRHYDGQWEGISLRTSVVNHMLAYPEETFKRFDLDPKDYSFYRFSLEGARMNKRSISNFPVLMVRDKDHKKWAENFLNSQDFEYYREMYEEHIKPLQFEGQANEEAPF